MSDEELNQETVSDETPSDTPISNGYCTCNDVLSLFGDISDEPPTETVNTAINNSTAWIEANLKRHYVPIPTTHPQALKTVAVYHSASDILLSLYHGEELPVQYDIWFQKAQDLLDAYIDEYLNAEATAEEQVNVQMVKHSHGRTYNRKRHRRGVRRWVR